MSYRWMKLAEPCCGSPLCLLVNYGEGRTEMWCMVCGNETDGLQQAKDMIAKARGEKA